MIRSRIREILYCDDTEEQRYAMRRILEGAGYTVIEAATGNEALARIHPAVLCVVLDVRLPDISGYEVCRRIKGNPATAGIPVLQISASFADPVLRAAGLEGGADAYVAQPVHPAELLSLVAALMRSHDTERTLRFQAEVSRQLALSLDSAETLQAVEQVFVPRFADSCHILLRPTPSTGHSHTFQSPLETPCATHFPPDLLEAASRSNGSGQAQLISAGCPVPHAAPPHSADRDFILAPLAVGKAHLGAIVFEVDGNDRQYRSTDLPLAQDLADRCALALQNAALFTAQRLAQDALVQSEKLAAAGRLSAAIAHEINNPLESITNLMYLIDTSDEITPTLKGYVQEALSELSRLTHIARQSLGFYRELTGPRAFDLNDSVDNTLNIYLKRFQAKHIQIHTEYASGKLEVCGVKGEIRQVISNLLVNAYDALPDRGALTIQTERLAPVQPGETPRVAFRVTDNGPGIPTEVLPRIFEPFFTTKQGTGTGLGLWVSDTIVTKHGGAIEATSRTDGPTHGSTFEVTLPSTTPEQPS